MTTTEQVLRKQIDDLLQEGVMHEITRQACYDALYLLTERVEGAIHAYKSEKKKSVPPSVIVMMTRLEEALKLSAEFANRGDVQAKPEEPATNEE